MGCTLWFTGLPSSGKTTLASALCARLGDRVETEHLDGDAIRSAFFPELGFSRHDRHENIRRIGDLALRFASHDVLSIVSVIAPFTDARDAVRANHLAHGIEYVEIFVDAPLEVCKMRDVKGLYRQATRGEIHTMTGIQSAYEVPANPDLRVDTTTPIEECLGQIMELLEQRLGVEKSSR